jgi:hypothetical protein
VHKIPARVQCTEQVCELVCRTCTPHHTVAGRSSVSLTQSPFAFPSNYRFGPPLTSYMPGRSIPCTRTRHSSIHHRTLCSVHGLCTSGLNNGISPLCIETRGLTPDRQTLILKAICFDKDSHFLCERGRRREESDALPVKSGRTVTAELPRELTVVTTRAGPGVSAVLGRSHTRVASSNPAQSTNSMYVCSCGTVLRFPPPQYPRSPVTCLGSGLDAIGSIPSREKILFSSAQFSDLPHIKWVPWAHSLVAK